MRKLYYCKKKKMGSGFMCVAGSDFASKSPFSPKNKIRSGFNLGLATCKVGLVTRSGFNFPTKKPGKQIPYPLPKFLCLQYTFDFK